LYHGDFEEYSLTFDFTDQHKQQIVDCMQPIHMNLARCAFQQGKYRKAISHASQVSKVMNGEGNTPDSIIYKVHLIMGKAYLHLEDYDKAETEFSLSNAVVDDNEGEAYKLLNISRAKRCQAQRESQESWKKKIRDTSTTHVFNQRPDPPSHADNDANTDMKNEHERAFREALEEQLGSGTSFKLKDTLMTALKNSILSLTVMFAAAMFVLIMKLFNG
jgi:tetratricopeptide (TPR) repeat protein